ncbi:LOW QUALITY PROTEIN: olfactory receptor 24-like [Tachyglossus aculeatus]|uniref:LOW QUALITY PROTEIN: olfactory receptor 24-like n=1 Tax=Tachyglossus aculeatus TaxID=9261 RepID=UPI0018F54CDE|nr:LOW QUALITY PROTEIN: olfactory receptor 24-like [Tachyglossus aculeatus]
MDSKNHTSASEFILQGLSDRAEHQQLLFVLFLCMYLLTALGNLLIILAISSDPHLHTPMYFFLCNLSLVDLCLASNTVPKVLANIQSNSISISYTCCLTQMYFFHFFGIMDSVLIAVMAYDRFVAICHPLHYTSIMNPRLCALMVALPWIFSGLISLAHTILMSCLSFCAANELPHFFCDLTPLLRLSCSDTTANEALVFIVAGAVIAAPFIFILASYARIVLAILKVPSAGGRKKAFSTCSSHLSVVFLFYGTTIGVYLSPSSGLSALKDKAFAVMYTVVTPTLNPFIYSLRNKDMKRALRKVFYKKVDTSQ